MSEHVPTPEQVNAFKAAWHDADDSGQAGKRVEIALAKVLGPALATARREGQAEAWERGVRDHAAGYGMTPDPGPNPYRTGAGQ